MHKMIDKIVEEINCDVTLSAQPVRGIVRRVREVRSCDCSVSESMDISEILDAIESHPGPSNGGDEIRNGCSNFWCSCTALHIIDLHIS